MSRKFRVGVILSALLTGGCGNDSKIGRLPDPPMAPKPVPVRYEALDPNLHQRAKEELARAVDSADPHVRANTIEAIQEAVGDEGKDAVLKGLNDSEAVVRFASAMAAGTMTLLEAKPQLLIVANDSNPHVRVAARYALHRLGDTHLSRDLEVFIRDPDPRVRSDTAIALGLLGEKTALRVLNPLLEDPDPLVRLQVAEAMWRLGDEQALPILVASSVSAAPVTATGSGGNATAQEAAEDADEQVIALLALAAPHDRRVIGHVEGRLLAETGEVALAAARAMGELGSDEGYIVARKGVRSKDPQLRMMGALAFGAIGRSDAQSLLEPLLKDSEPSVRIAAATGILQLKPPSGA